MVKVIVKFLSMIRERAGIGKIEFSASGESLGEIVREISRKYHLQDLLFLENGSIRPYARILLNGRSQEFMVKRLGTKVKDNDVIALVYSFPYHENV